MPLSLHPLSVFMPKGVDQATRARERRGLQSRLIRVFAVQATLVSVATILGVYAAYKIAEDYLVQQALLGEARHYWSLWDERPGYPLPNTSNMHGYMGGALPEQRTHLPETLRSLPGDYYGRVALDGRHPLVLVSENQGQRLYLVFKEEQVSRLAFFFGIAPLTVVLLLIYLASWFTFRQSQRLISPVTQLARIVDTAAVRDMDGLAEKLEPFSGIDADIDALVAALNHYTRRLSQFVEREQSFTRDASHELRTPLAVMRGSLDILQTQTNLTEQQARVLDRMRQTVRDMEGLIETLLFLAREDNLQPAGEKLVVNSRVPQVISQVCEALACDPGTVEVRSLGQLQVLAPERVISIILTNLLRNAIQHGEGKAVQVIIDGRSIQVRDQGPGMNDEQVRRSLQPFFRVQANGSGHGLGLAIVKRLCDQFQWTLSISSAPNQGTLIRVELGPQPA